MARAGVIKWAVEAENERLGVRNDKGENRQ